MSFKKILESKRAQGMMEYICLAMVVFAALLAAKFIILDSENPYKDNPIVKAFNTTVDHVMVNDFGAQVGE